MAASNIRKKLITWLADADKKKVKALYTLLEEEINKVEAVKLSEGHLKILEERKARYKSGKENASSWHVAHERIRNKRP